MLKNIVILLMLMTLFLVASIKMTNSELYITPVAESPENHSGSHKIQDPFNQYGGQYGGHVYHQGQLHGNQYGGYGGQNGGGCYNHGNQHGGHNNQGQHHGNPYGGHGGKPGGGHGNHGQHGSHGSNHHGGGGGSHGGSHGHLQPGGHVEIGIHWQ